MIDAALNALGGAAGAIMNMVPLPGKITLLPVKKYSPIPIPSGTPFVAMFNPDQWSEADKFVYNDSQENGTKPAIQRFNSVRSQNLSFELLIDGTGASGDVKEVTKEIYDLRKTVGFNGDIHRPNKLFIIWGYFIFKGVITDLDIQYTLFRPNGTPLRAKVKLSFKEDTDTVERQLDLNLKSADLTHHRLVKEGDRLDNLTNSIYNSPRYVTEVAKANNLTTFRKIPVGKEFVFPPIEK
jgi:hypothetical protein